MRAVILAGGMGTRLKPYTITLPKPLVPVAGEPIMKHLLKNLKREGIKEVYICVNHMGDLISAYFGNGSEQDIKINYSYENEPLGTVAPIKLVKGLPEDFVVINGDVLTDLSIENLFKDHKKSGAILTVATYQRKEKIDYGVLKFDSDNQINYFVEKPKYLFDVSMGVYVFNKKIFDYVPDNKHFGFDDLMEVLLENGEKIQAYPHDGYWMDIGRPEDYEQANIDMLEHLAKVENIVEKDVKNGLEDTFI